VDTTIGCSINSTLYEFLFSKFALKQCKTAQKARIPMGFLGIFAESSGVFAPDECLMDQRFDKFIKHSRFSGMLLALSLAVKAAPLSWCQ
jgi:hypothetical protein